MFNIKNKAPGFSLIELMVVIAIIAILAAVAVPAYNNYIFRAKMSSISNDINSLYTQASLFYNKNGTMPGDSSQISFPTNDLFSSIQIQTNYDGGCNNRPYTLIFAYYDPTKFPNGYISNGATLNIAIEPDNKGQVHIGCGTYGANVNGAYRCPVAYDAIGGSGWPGC